MKNKKHDLIKTIPDPKKISNKIVILTDEEIELVENLSASCNIEQIAGYFGVCETTFHKIKKRQPAVSIAYKRGKSKAIVHVAKHLFTQIENGSTAATIFYLKTQAGWKEAKDESNTYIEEDIKSPKLIVEFIAPKSEFDNLKEVHSTE